MTPINQQFELSASQVADWRQSLDAVDRAIDAAYWTLAALSERASQCNSPATTRQVATGIADLVRHWKLLAADIDEITTFERIHDLVSRLEALGLYVEVGLEPAEGE